MRILILGGTGMLGHMLWACLSERLPSIYTTIRASRDSYAAGELFNSKKVIDFVDVTDFPELRGVMKCVKPDIILNCIGVTKRRLADDDDVQAIELNALLPHKLLEWGRVNSAKVITFSTDCVFDGEKGAYVDDSPTNARDLYGKTKALGEIYGKNSLTLRSSFIGPELGEGTELLEWFLAQSGTVKGFNNAIYSGVTTLELSRIVEKIVFNYPEANGLYNISSEPISKFDLLMLIKNKLRPEVDVVPDATFSCDRSLDSSKFRKEFKYTPPAWESMIDEVSDYI